jgi:elongation factor Ts
MERNMAIEASIVKELREKTGAGMMDCKRALEESGGDIEEAQKILRKKGITKVERRAQRDTKEGLVEAYIHPGGKIGVLIEVNCETDFVAKTDEFKRMVRDLAMQVAATDPLSISNEDLDPSIIERETEIYRVQAKETGKPDNITEKIVKGRLQKYFQEVCLLDQPFVKDTDTSVRDRVTEVASKLGENIVIRRYIRFLLGS